MPKPRICTKGLKTEDMCGSRLKFDTQKWLNQPLIRGPDPVLGRFGPFWGVSGGPLGYPPGHRFGPPPDPFLEGGPPGGSRTGLSNFVKP